MSSRKYKKPFNIDLKPSKFLFYFIVIIHLLALSVLTLNLNIHASILSVLFILICVSLYVSLKHNNSINFKIHIKQIQFIKEMEWHLIDSDKKIVAVELQENWFILPQLLILYFKTNINVAKHKTIIILPDMLNQNELRQLKLHLRLMRY